MNFAVETPSDSSLADVPCGLSFWMATVSRFPLEQSPGIGGDVIFMPNQDFGQLHRIVARSVDGRLCVQGDALPRPDGWIDASDILGILTEQRRNGRPVRVKTTSGCQNCAHLAICRRRSSSNP